MGINAFSKRMLHSWPIEKPQLNYDSMGWFPDANKSILTHYLGIATIVLELGSYLGLSTRFILENTSKRSVVIAADTWLGSLEMYDLESCENRRPILYEQFIANCWSYRDRLVVVRNTSAIAIRFISKCGVTPDLVYIDASHEFEDVMADVRLCCRLFPDAVLVGDDYNWEGVKNGVQSALQQCNIDPSSI